MATKKKWHNWNNIINQDQGSRKAPNTVQRSADNHKTDSARFHIPETSREMKHERLKRGDLVEGHKKKHLEQGYRKEPIS